MRIYVAADLTLLQALAAGGRVTGLAFRAESEDEEDELAALEAAAEHGRIVVVAEVEGSDDSLTLEDVASFHADLDGSGHLAWFATQEIDAVLRVAQEH